MKRRLCEESWWNWRKHRGPNAKHPYLHELPDKPRLLTAADRRKADRAIALLGFVAGLAPGPR